MIRICWLATCLKSSRSVYSPGTREHVVDLELAKAKLHENNGVVFPSFGRISVCQ